MTDAPYRLHDVTSDGTFVTGTMTVGSTSHQVRVPLSYEWASEAARRQFREAEIQAPAAQYQPGCRRAGP